MKHLWIIELVELKYHLKEKNIQKLIKKSLNRNSGLSKREWNELMLKFDLKCF